MMESRSTLLFLASLLLIGVGVVLGEVPHAPLDLLSKGLETNDFPLLFLDIADGLKDYFDDPIILFLMILVEPEVVYHHEDPLGPPPPDHVEEGPDADEDVQGSNTFTLPLLVHLVERSTLHAIVSGLIASFTLPRAVLLADVVFGQLIPDTVAGLVFALSNVELIAVYAG